MKYRANITKFRKKILAWYEQEGRNFAWRSAARSHYDKIIAEILLQRTKAETVAKFYENFLARYPDWQTIVSEEHQLLEEALKPIGLYRQRAASLKRLAIVLAKNQGAFPSKRNEIDDLPGIGQYIANSIELLCHGKRRPLIDVNMTRVLERYFGPRKLADIRYDPYLQGLAKKVVNSSSAVKLNFAILDFAAKVCTARNPKCPSCPLRNECRYARALI